MSIPINFRWFFWLFYFEIVSQSFILHSPKSFHRSHRYIVLLIQFHFSMRNPKDIFLLFGDVIGSENRHFSSDRKTTTTSTNWGQFPFNNFGIFSSKTWHLTNLLFCCCKKPYLVFSWESCFLFNISNKIARITISQFCF